MKIILLVAALTFHANPGGKSEFLAPEFTMKSVVAEDTPGSSEWYVPVDKLKLPTRWRITRNGHTVTNSSGGSRIALAPTTGLWPRDDWNGIVVRDWYCGYDVVNADYVRLPGESDPDPQYFNLASPEMFNLTWNTLVGSTNYYYSATACQKDVYDVSSLYSGRELFKPKSSRFDSIARSALLASYEAYYERLYYASQGQRNEWDPDDWGETGDPQRFNFNPTNDLVATTQRFHPSYPISAFEMVNEEVLRPVPASHRLLDADNITNIIYNVRDLFPAYIQANGLGDEVDPWPQVLDARPFVFRPHWLTDQRDFPRNDHFGVQIWWASTIPPPVSKQLIWGSNGDHVESTTIDLFPEIGNWQTVDELYTAGVPFACYATTLEMLKPGDNFSPSGYYQDGPCFNLVASIVSDCQSAYDGRLLDINIFDVHGLTVPGFLTNCYPRAAASVPNRQDAYDRYVDVGTDTRISRRMVPGRLDLVNQLLSVMDRTIMIPSMHITSTNETHSWQHSCDYLGDELTIKVRWNGSSWDILSGIEIAEEYELHGTPELSDDKGEEIVDGIRASVSATYTTTNSTAIWGTVSSEGILWLPDDQWDFRDDRRPLTNVVIFVEEAAGVGIWARIDMANYSKIGYSGVPGSIEGSSPELELSASPSVQLSRSYTTSHPASAGNIGIALGPHQPGFEAGNRVVDCKYAVLAAKTTDSLVFSPMWRSEVGSYDPGGLADVLASFGESRHTEVIGDVQTMCGGPALTAPGDYIPLPSTARLVFDNIPPTADGRFDVSAIDSSSELVGTNTIHHFTLMPPGETVEASHSGQLYIEAWVDDVAVIQYFIHTFDSNMVERVEYRTEEEPWPYPTAPNPPIYHDYGTTIESTTHPDQIELEYINDYPSTVELSGQATTNTTFQDFVYEYRLVYYHQVDRISYVYESDHTRDWQEEYYNGFTSTVHNVNSYDIVSNLTTTVELTVTNNLPDDAVEYHADYIEYKADVEYVLIVDKKNKVSLYRHWTNPLTGEEFWKQQDRPFPIGHYFYECDLLVPGRLEADVGPEHDAFDESIFFRVMTQVDWLWNFMRIDK